MQSDCEFCGMVKWRICPLDFFGALIAAAGFGVMAVLLIPHISISIH